MSTHMPRMFSKPLSASHPPQTVTPTSNLMRLFTRRCFKIRMRFKSRLFKKPMLGILQEWKYDDGTDNLGELDRVCHIDPPHLHEYFGFAHVPFQNTTDTTARQSRRY